MLDFALRSSTAAALLATLAVHRASTVGLVDAPSQQECVRHGRHLPADDFDEFYRFIFLCEHTKVQGLSVRSQLWAAAQGYSFALSAHPLLEGNSPAATFGDNPFPAWSVTGNFALFRNLAMSAIHMW